MKESGINYFYNNLGLYSGDFAIYYTFETGVGNVIPSISGGQTQYSGILSSSTNFWIKPGSGFFSGNELTIQNTQNIDESAWTDIFIYEKINTDDCILFNSLDSSSGYKIGITKSNRPYFESFNQEPVLASSLNNYSSKNVVSFTYLTNYLIIGYYNFNSKTVESETFNYPFNVNSSNIRKLGGSYTGWMDTYIHLTNPISPEVQAQLLSGLWATPTGVEYPINYVCSTGITGYQDIFVYTTGVTGYVTTPGGDVGKDYFTGQFPTFYSSTSLTGYLSTGTLSSGVSGVICYPVTGEPVTAFVYDTGYASSFGMQKIEFLDYVATTDVIKYSYSNTLFNNIYNLLGQRQYSGFYLFDNYTTGQINLYLNGLAIAQSGWTITGGFLLVSGASDTDTLTFVNQTGSQQMLPLVPTRSGYGIAYIGQEIFLNGINLVSGYDFTVTGGYVNLLAKNTGINGYIFEYPQQLLNFTGNSTLTGNLLFNKNTSNIYKNGLKQILYGDYIEGATFDMLSGNRFNASQCSNMYNNNNLYWE